MLTPFALGPRLGIERCGKINAVKSCSESWTGIGVVAGCAVVVFIRQGPLVKKMDACWRIELLQILQEVRRDYKTRNYLQKRCESTLIFLRAGSIVLRRRSSLSPFKRLSRILTSSFTSILHCLILSWSYSARKISIASARNSTALQTRPALLVCLPRIERALARLCWNKAQPLVLLKRVLAYQLAKDSNGLFEAEASAIALAEFADESLQAFAWRSPSEAVSYLV